EQLGQLYGKAKLWKEAVTQVRNEARRNKKQSMLDKQMEETDALRQLGLFVRNNCYYALGEEEDEPVRISNFTMVP
ncbi:DNA primase, partial [gut metagenome]